MKLDVDEIFVNSFFFVFDGQIKNLNNDFIQIRRDEHIHANEIIFTSKSDTLHGFSSLYVHAVFIFFFFFSHFIPEESQANL